jgi:glycosyltransferase involved in cell wall biosynthesis
MPRSTLAAMATLKAVRRTNVSYVYDSDGLALDERVDFEGWEPTSLKYRFLRSAEADAIRRADRVLTRSHAAIDVLVERGGPAVSSDRFSVVVNGRDETKFMPVNSEVRHAVRRELGVEEGGLLLVYTGSVGKQYCVNEMLELFRRVRRLNSASRFLLLTGDVHALEPYFEGYEEEKPFCTYKRVLPDEVPRYLAASDIGLALRVPSFSMKAVDPIKIGEYLLCGVPVIATAGIGDTSEYLDHEAGLVLRSHSADSLAEAAKWIVNEAVQNADAFRENCRKRGLERFGLCSAAEAYERALRLACQV